MSSLNPKVLSCFSGTYLGFLEFDGVRYWDIRDLPGEEASPVDETEALPSDSRFRPDLIALREALEGVGSASDEDARIAHAQAVKEHLEKEQRAERALRTQGRREMNLPDPIPFVPERFLKEENNYWP